MDYTTLRIDQQTFVFPRVLFQPSMTFGRTSTFQTLRFANIFFPFIQIDNHVNSSVLGLLLRVIFMHFLITMLYDKGYHDGHLLIFYSF